MGVLSQTASANRERGVLFSDREMDGDTNPSSIRKVGPRKPVAQEGAGLGPLL